MNFSISRLFLLVIAAITWLQPNILLSAAAGEIGVDSHKHYVVTDDQKRHLNLVIILEDGITENQSNDRFAMMSEFSNALKAESSPILVAGSLAYNFFSRNAQAKIKYNNRYEQKKNKRIKNLLYKNLIEAIQTMLSVDIEALTGTQIQEIENFIVQKEDEILTDEHKERIEEIKAVLNKLKRIYTKFPFPYGTAECISLSEAEIKSNKKLIGVAIDRIKSIIGKEVCLLELFEMSLRSAMNIDDHKDLNDIEKVTYCCGLYEFVFENWVIFKHPDDNFYLFIPREYKAAIEKTWLDSITRKKIDFSHIEGLSSIAQQELISGFALTKLQKIETYEDLMRLLNRFEKKFWFQRSTNINMLALQDFFIKKSKSSIINELMGYWNIVLSGHGRSSTDIQCIAQDIASQKTNAEYKEVVDCNALICNVSLVQMKNFLGFLYHAINTHSLFMESCYIGGYHSYKIAEWISQLERNKDVLGNGYIIIVRGLAEMITSSNCRFFIKNLATDEIIKLYKNYFIGLQSLDFLSESEKLEQLKKTIKDFDSYEANNIENIASVRFPGGQWIILPLDGVAVIDQATDMKNEQIVINNKDVLLLQTDVIQKPIILYIDQSYVPASGLCESLPLLVFGLIGDQRYQLNKIEVSMIRYDGIKRPINLVQFLKESVYLYAQEKKRTCIYTTTLHIDHLICKNYNGSGISTSREDEILELNDVCITIAPSKKIFGAADAKKISGSISFRTQDGQRLEGVWNDTAKTVDKWSKVDEISYDYTPIKSENMAMALAVGSLYLLSFAISRS